MEIKSTNTSSTKGADNYKDKEIQKEVLTTKDVIPDEVPRSDGPGGE